MVTLFSQFFSSVMIRPSYSALASAMLGLSSVQKVISAEEDYVVVDSLNVPQSVVSVEPFRNVPPQLSEIDEIIERVTATLMQQQGLMYTVQPSQLEIVSNRVFSLLSSSQRFAILDALSNDPMLLLPNSSANKWKWSILKETYPCGCCGDVLAAPALTSCLHSFCGLCLLNQSHETSSLICPECNTKVIGSCIVYERNLAEQLEQLVNKTEDCVEKSAWMARNEQYKAYRLEEDSKNHTPNLVEDSSSSFEDFARDNLIPIAVLCLFAISVMRRL